MFTCATCLSVCSGDCPADWIRKIAMVRCGLLLLYLVMKLPLFIKLNSVIFYNNSNNNNNNNSSQDNQCLWCCHHDSESLCVFNQNHFLIQFSWCLSVTNRPSILRQITFVMPSTIELWLDV